MALLDGGRPLSDAPPRGIGSSSVDVVEMVRISSSSSTPSLVRWPSGAALVERTDDQQDALVEQLTVFVWGATSATARHEGCSGSRRASLIARETPTDRRSDSSVGALFALGRSCLSAGLTTGERFSVSAPED